MHSMVANSSVIELFPLNINSWVNLTLGQPHLAKKRGIVGPSTQPICKAKLNLLYRIQNLLDLTGHDNTKSLQCLDH